MYSNTNSNGNSNNTNKDNRFYNSYKNEVANEMDRIIYDKSRGCNYLNGYQAEENEIRIQLALYKHNISPSFKIKLKGDKWYCTTNNGTYIKENTTASTTNTFSLISYNNYNTMVNEEGWKPCEIRIKRTAVTVQSA